jgi:hypothetical protein
VVLHLCHADPENKLYDLLKLNEGIKETFFTPSTPFAFLKRFTKPDGTKELLEVLSKWNKGKNTRLTSLHIFHDCLIHGDLLVFSVSQLPIFLPSKVKRSTRVEPLCLTDQLPYLLTTMNRQGHILISKRCWDWQRNGQKRRLARNSRLSFLG